jgi:methionine-rich copper-binding protein CopC
VKLALLAIGITLLTSNETSRHLRLDRSIPGIDSTLASPPSHVVLWYTQKPTVAVTSFTLRTAGGDTILLGPLSQCPADSTMVSARIQDSLVRGRYVLAWRTAGADGHVIRGEIPFRIR